MTAVLAIFVDFRTVRTRGACQIILELPIENADAALKALGGIPQPATERWVGVALAPRDREAPKKDRQSFDSLQPSAQAGILCTDPNFEEFLETQYPSNLPMALTDRLRDVCQVKSRSEFNTDTSAANRWLALLGHFKTWQTDRRYEQSRTR